MSHAHRIAIVAPLVVGILSNRASAHVEYVVEDGDSTVDPVSFAVGVVSEPINAALLVVVGVGVLAAIGGYRRRRPGARDIAVLEAALAEYDAYLPWMLRLAVGLPLVGAGFAGYYFSPAVLVEARVLQVGIGFLLLFGLATRAVAVAGLVAYLVGLLSYPEIVFAFEYVGGLGGIALVGGGRPSADHLLQRVADAPGTTYGRFDPVHRLANRYQQLVGPVERYLPLVVRIPLGLTFAFLGVWEKLANPAQALAVVEKYDLTGLVPVDAGLWVVGAGLTEFVVGVALLFGILTRATAAVGFLTLTLTLFGLPDDPVLAHVTLFGLTSVLFVTGGGPLSVDRWLTNRRT